jgi:hypothetical protein
LKIPPSTSMYFAICAKAWCVALLCSLLSAIFDFQIPIIITKFALNLIKIFYWRVYNLHSP